MKNYKLILFLGLLFVGYACSNTGVEIVKEEKPVLVPIAKTTYVANVKSIIDANCIMCHHNNPSPQAGLNLTTFANVKAAVINQPLISRIKNTANPMPPKPRAMLSASDIAIIEKWKSDGYAER